MAQRDNKLNIEIARANKRDSAAMKTIAILTMLFLPGAYIAVSSIPLKSCKRRSTNKNFRLFSVWTCSTGRHKMMKRFFQDTFGSTGRLRYRSQLLCSWFGWLGISLGRYRLSQHCRLHLILLERYLVLLWGWVAAPEKSLDLPCACRSLYCEQSLDNSFSCTNDFVYIKVNYPLRWLAIREGLKQKRRERRTGLRINSYGRVGWALRIQIEFSGNARAFRTNLPLRA